MTAHPDDILVVCWLEEARFYPQFMNSQVVNVASPEKLHGRHFRTAWVTERAAGAMEARIWKILDRECWFQDAEIKPISEYQETE